MWHSPLFLQLSSPATSVHLLEKYLLIIHSVRYTLNACKHPAWKMLCILWLVPDEKSLNLGFYNIE